MATGAAEWGSAASNNDELDVIFRDWWSKVTPVREALDSRLAKAAANYNCIRGIVHGGEDGHRNRADITKNEALRCCSLQSPLRSSQRASPARSEGRVHLAPLDSVTPARLGQVGKRDAII